MVTKILRDLALSLYEPETGTGAAQPAFVPVLPTALT